MKLNELHGYKQYADKDLQGIVDYLKSKGTIFANNGKYSKVIIGNNYVYKIWVDDLAYEDWLRVCRKHEGNPWVPKLIGPTRPMKLFFKHVEFNERISELKIQKMEKLEAIPDLVKSGYFAQILDELIGDDVFSNEEEFKHALKVKLTKQTYDNDLILSKSLELYEVISDIKHMLNTNEYINDMHLENFMMRGNQPVITDPLQTGQSGIFKLNTK